MRSTLPYAVGPGEEVDINASIAFPGNTGKYIIQWDMVNEGFGWFGNGKFVSEKQTKITFHSEFWIYLIWFFTFLLMVYLSVLISDFIKTKTLGFRKSIQSMFFVLIGYFDIIWITISLYFKVKWGTVLISGDINSVKLMVLGVIITALVLNCFINRKIRFFVTILLNIMVSLLIFSDLIYFRYFNDVITTGTIFNAKQLANVTDSISNLIDYKYAIYLFFDIFMFAILYIFLRTSFPKNGAIKKSRIIYSLVLLVSTLGISGVMFNNLAKEDLFQKKYQNKLIVQDIGLINFHLYDFTSYLGQKIRRISPSELKEINEWKSEKDNDKYDQYFGIARNKNVILIQSEALQNFVINLTYNNQVITPNLNKFASNNLYFNNFYDQTGPGRTSDAEFISLNSLFGLQSGSVYTTYNNNKLDSLPKILNENNYDTMSAHGYNGAFWSRSRMHRLQGFQKSYFQEDLVLDEKIGWGLSDKTFLRQSLDKMISLKQPFFHF
ncbi:sulfatase-like hydrolase/transferase [Paenibacillus sp. JTLBN-2024]